MLVISITSRNYQSIIFVQKLSGLKFLFCVLLGLLCNLAGFAQVPDTLTAAKDSTRTPSPVTAVSPLQKILGENKYLNSQSQPVSLGSKNRIPTKENAIFYILAGLLFFFGIVKTLYSRYFSTLFRVFFNSSLRQSQLTDQLMQAKLPSLFFNLVFLISASLYVYFLLQKISFKTNEINWMLLLLCISAFALVYAGKFIAVKFFGWMTGFNSEADTYIFIVFLINKIIGVCLLPIIIMLAFSDMMIVKVIIVISFILVGMMLLLRFVRSYGLLQHKLKINRFHFILYIFSFELLPLAIIYKAVELFIMKKV
ncbi:MAG: DUF4271 domain-containing protein [Sphingobacteriales bacterium]|nr:MAG: DUF4271 domain-containing protein [Sphingobacteriales bacterium]